MSAAVVWRTAGCAIRLDGSTAGGFSLPHPASEASEMLRSFCPQVLLPC